MPENYLLISFALGSAFFGALANIMARTLLKDIKAKDILGLNFLTMAAILTLFAHSFYHFDATIYTITLVFTIGILDTAANYFYFKTFEKTETSTATPILSISPVIAFIFGCLEAAYHRQIYF